MISSTSTSTAALAAAQYQSVLPSTGGPGSGTALLVAVGITLLAAAGTLIVARKRIFG